jgi:tetratricopeptide (TPR) repeat protein
MKVLLRSAILGNHNRRSAEVASLIGVFREDTPHAMWLLSWVEHSSGHPSRCRQRLVETRSAIEVARPRLAPDDTLDLLYATEVLDGACAFAMGEEEVGSNALARAAAIDPAAEDHFVMQASHFKNTDRVRLALRVMEELVAKAERLSVDSFVVYLGILRDLGLHDREVVILRRAQQLYPGDSRLEAYLALYRVNTGSALACGSLERLYRLDPMRAESAFNHALCLRQAKEHKTAISVLETTLVQHPAREDLLTLLSGIYLESGRELDAQALWKRKHNEGLGASRRHGSQKQFGSTDVGVAGSDAEGASRFLIQSIDKAAPRPNPAMGEP